jgi:hypothetical protein
VQDASVAGAVECIGALAPGAAPAGTPYSNRAKQVRACAVGSLQTVASERGMCARLAVELIGGSAGEPAEDGSTGALDAPSRLVPLTLQPLLLARCATVVVLLVVIGVVVLIRIVIDEEVWLMSECGSVIDE